MAKEINPLILKIASGIKKQDPISKEDKITKVEIVEGTKQFIINYLNEKFKTVFLKSRFETEPLFNFNFSNKEELYDITNWFTIDQLAEGGILELEEN